MDITALEIIVLSLMAILLLSLLYKFLSGNWEDTKYRTVVYKECRLCFYRENENIFLGDRFSDCTNPFCKSLKSVCPRCKKCSVCRN